MEARDVKTVEDAKRIINERGIVGVRAPNPVTMIEYWKNPDATAKKYAGGFLLTGDVLAPPDLLTDVDEGVHLVVADGEDPVDPLQP